MVDCLPPSHPVSPAFGGSLALLQVPSATFRTGGISLSGPSPYFLFLSIVSYTELLSPSLSSVSPSRPVAPFCRQHVSLSRMFIFMLYFLP